jgi:hypothetical protein
MEAVYFSRSLVSAHKYTQNFTLIKLRMVSVIFEGKFLFYVHTACELLPESLAILCSVPTSHVALTGKKTDMIASYSAGPAK